ncbi:tyrosine-type recombinase/integrase [Lysinibacillus sp. FSL M8-0216]|uniref:tyrosine-type recombinase/integrase n=1 Tax=Lysinibacillus sp. FSL M8-0216 TaxID=2921619 RepID=UPI00315A6259
MLIKFAIQDFLSERKMMNASEFTLINYRSFFRGFQEWLRENNIQDVQDITTNTLRLYLMYCKNEKGNSPNTINNKVKNLKAFFNHLIENEFVQHNPCLKLKKQQTDERIEVFTDAHIRQMLRYYRRMKRKDHEFTAYRNTAMIITLLGTGIRLGEMRGLKFSDVHIKHISIFGKNRKLETVPLTKKVYNELIDLKLYYERYFGHEVEYVFVHRNGEQISYEAIKGVFKKLQEVMNFKDIRLSAHTFRHTFAQKFLLNGGDVFTLQKILRHTSLSMTEKYLALWGSALHEQNEKYNPLNNLDI